jgi:cytochrome c oxidase subunit 1
VESFTRLIPVERGITWSAFLLAAVQLVFLFNVFWSARRGVAESGTNPWRATTLEWSPIAHPIIGNGPYEYAPAPAPGDNFLPQWEPEKPF